jgi:hypothetical protein
LAFAETSTDTFGETLPETTLKESSSFVGSLCEEVGQCFAKALRF